MLIWGAVYHANDAIAVYYVHWTINHPDHSANFDLFIGKWGEGTSAEDRQAVALAFRNGQEGPQFMVIDAQDPLDEQEKLATKALSRNEVIGTPIAQDAFAIVDALLFQESRIAELIDK
jgi:hypothetical protein